MAECGDSTLGTLAAGQRDATSLGLVPNPLSATVTRTYSTPCPGRSIQNVRRGANVCEATDATAWADLAAAVAEETQVYAAELVAAGAVYSQAVEDRMVQGSIVADRLMALVPVLAGFRGSGSATMSNRPESLAFTELYQGVYGEPPDLDPSTGDIPFSAAVWLARYALRLLSCAQEELADAARVQGVEDVTPPERPPIPEPRPAFAPPKLWGLLALGALGIGAFLALRR